MKSRILFYSTWWGWAASQACRRRERSGAEAAGPGSATRARARARAKRPGRAVGMRPCKAIGTAVQNGRNGHVRAEQSGPEPNTPCSRSKRPYKIDCSRPKRPCIKRLKRPHKRPPPSDRGRGRPRSNRADPHAAQSHVPSHVRLGDVACSPRSRRGRARAGRARRRGFAPDRFYAIARRRGFAPDQVRHPPGGGGVAGGVGHVQEAEVAAARTHIGVQVRIKRPK